MRDRHLLLVAYHFGTGAATGALRWNAMAADLARRGWTFDVITLARPQADRAPTDEYELAPGILVLPVAQPSWLDRVVDAGVGLKHRLVPPRDPSARPAGGGSALGPDDVRIRRPGASGGLYRDLMASVDAGRLWYAERAWAARAGRAGLERARERRPGAVIVSSPPHLAHLAGMRLARALAVPLVADFRDPWIFGHPLECAFSGLERRLGPRYESMTLRTANLVVCNTERARGALERAYPADAGKLVVLPNGYDSVPAVASPDRAHFKIAFTGWLYPFMDPRPLFAAVGRLKRRGSLDGAVLRLEFMGTEPSFGGVPLADLARAGGIADCFALHPRAPRAEALRFQQSAAVLVAFDYPHPLSVPTKFYDQAQMRGSMLLIGNPEGALADAARSIGITVHAGDDAAGIDATLDAALERWRRGAFGQPMDPEGLFDRKRQSQRLVEMLSSLGDAMR